MERKYEKEIAQVIAKAWADPAFKETLINSPKEAFLSMGIVVPEDIQVHVHENKANEWHYSLPVKPEGEIAETDLRQASGGFCPICSGGEC